ncbi:MAG: hypothetical protein ACOYJ2_01765 [Rickettsiales bacterium]
MSDVPNPDDEPQSIADLIVASAKAAPLATNGTLSGTRVYNFVQPDLKDYVIRIRTEYDETQPEPQKTEDLESLRAALLETSSLVPPEWVIKGQSVGQTLLAPDPYKPTAPKGFDVSILYRQKGESIESWITKTIHGTTLHKADPWFNPYELEFDDKMKVIEELLKFEQSAFNRHSKIIIG